MAKDAVTETGLLRRLLSHRHVGRAGLVAAGIAIALVLFLAGAAVRLLIGPLSLGPFAGSLADAIDRALPGIAMKYDQAAVEWERDEGRISLVILGTRIFDRDGRIIAQAPKAEIKLAAGPFLHGRVEVKQIALVGVQLTLVRSEDGVLRLGVGKDRREEDILKRISDALKKSEGNATVLDSFAVRHARLAFYDEASKLFVVSPRADFLLKRSGERLAANINADVEISGHPVKASGTILFGPQKGAASGAFALTGLSLQALGANSKTFAMVKDTALKLDAEGHFALAGPAQTRADFSISGAGAVQIGSTAEGRLRVSRLKARGHFDGAAKRLVLDRAELVSDKLKAEGKGRLDFTVDAQGGLAGVGGTLALERLAVAWKGVFAAPVNFERVTAEGVWQGTDKTIILDKLSVDGKSIALEAKGRIVLAGNASPGVDISGSIAAIGVRDLVRYWPLGAAAGARDWVDANMPAGRVGPTLFEMHFAPGQLDGGAMPPEAVSVKFTVADAELLYIKGLTHMTGVGGSAVVTGNSFTADITSGRIGPLSVGAAKFVIPDFNVAEEVGIVTGRVRGALPDVLTLIDMGNLKYPTRFGINIASAKGDATADLSIRIPLLQSVGVDDVGLDIKAAVTGFGLQIGSRTQLSDGTIALQIDNNHLKASGTTGLGGSASRLSVEWTEAFKPVKGPSTRIAVKGTLDNTARASLGLGFEEALKGPIGVSGTLSGRRGDLSDANLSLDLTPTVVTLDLIALNKPAGFPMTAKVAAVFGEHSTLDSQTIRIVGPGTSVNATARYDATGKLVQLLAPGTRIGAQNDFSLNMTRGASGLDVVLHGRSLDGSRLGAQGSGSEAATFKEPFHLDVKLDRLMLRSGTAWSAFALDISGVADRPAAMSLTANLSKTATVTGRIVPADGGRRMTVATSDMGLLLQGLFGFSSIKGGKLDVSANFTGAATDTVGHEGPDFQGKATLQGFKVLNQPFLARLFTAGSLGGLANLMQGQGIQVDSFDVPFSSKNGVIAVHDVRATGPAIGVSADGYIDRPKNAIALKGSLVPLFGLNSVLGNIPLLGTVITSKEGEGIIGITYSVSGNTDQPDVSVNPLSALAPGILRRIFEGRMPTAAQAPSNAPAAAPAPKPKPANKDDKSTAHDGG